MGLTDHQKALEDGRLASSSSPCHHRMRRLFGKAKKSPQSKIRPLQPTEGVVYRRTPLVLGQDIEPEGDSDQLNLAMGDVDLITVAGVDVGGGSQVEHRGNRDGRSRSSGTSTPVSRHDDGVAASSSSIHHLAATDNQQRAPTSSNGGPSINAPMPDLADLLSSLQSDLDVRRSELERSGILQDHLVDRLEKEIKSAGHPQITRPEPQTLVERSERPIPAWKRLINRPLPTDERISLITAIFSDRNEADTVDHLLGGDAQTLVDVIDEVLSRSFSSEEEDQRLEA